MRQKRILRWYLYSFINTYLQHVTVTVGNEVDMKEHMWRFRKGSEIERRKAIADFVQKKLFDLGAEAAQDSL